MQKETLIQQINFINTHWKEKKVTTYDFKRDLFTKLWDDIDLKLMSLIVGPRRVGKSVLLKQLINELIQKKDINPKQILFFEFTPNDNKDTIWNVFNYFYSEVADTRLPIYILFDEIQYIDGYESTIKNLYDNTDKCKFILTGSLSISYKRRMQDSLAGRFFTYKLFPLNFLEFLKLHKTDDVELFENAIIETDKHYKEGYLVKLNADFRDFLANGRYPEVYNIPSIQAELYIKNLISQSLNQDAYSYFKIEKPSVINSLFDYIRLNNGGIISISKLASLSSTSTNTITSYLNILELMGLIYPVYNSTNPLIKSNSARKIYVNSSFSLLEPKLDISTSYGLAVESYILERLLESGKEVTFWRDRQKEVDFLIPKEKIGYEVKFRSEIEKLKFTPKDFDIKIISLLGDKPACLF